MLAPNEKDVELTGISRQRDWIIRLKCVVYNCWDLGTSSVSGAN
jgi:hypothetical protein